MAGTKISKSDLEVLTVAELREESKKRGLTLERKGKRFTKSELVENIMEHEKEQQEVIASTFFADGTEEAATAAALLVNAGNRTRDSRTKQQRTFDRIVSKFRFRRDDRFYNEEVKSGRIVLFVHAVKAKDGNVYYKLRTAKIIGVKRDKELLRVLTVFGTEIQITFDDILWIKDEGGEFPRIVYEYLNKTRTMKGREQIKKHFGA